MNTIYIIVDAHGNQLGGVATTERDIAAIAQEKADDRGAPVWYTTSDGEAVEVEVKPREE